MSGKSGMRSNLPSALPPRYVRGFAWVLDKRTVAARDVAGDLRDLWQDLGGLESLSAMQRMLIERATFLRRRLLAHESAVLGGKEPLMTPNEHTSAVNALLGLLKGLGLKRQAKDVGDLRTYLQAAEIEEVPLEGDDAA